MKTVKSTDHLNHLALSRGATVVVGGLVFNRAGDSVKDVVKQGKPVRAEVASPEPKPDPSIQTAVEAMSDCAAVMSESATQTMAEIKKVLEKMPATIEPDDKPKKWKLTVQRDTRGLLQSIDVEQS